RGVGRRLRSGVTHTPEPLGRVPSNLAHQTGGSRGVFARWSRHFPDGDAFLPQGTNRSAPTKPVRLGQVSQVTRLADCGISPAAQTRIPATGLQALALQFVDSLLRVGDNTSWGGYP